MRRAVTSARPSQAEALSCPARSCRTAFGFLFGAACDAIVGLYPGEVTRDLGALTPRAMARIGDGLRAALGFSS
jgi:hypothetical protein